MAKPLSLAALADVLTGAPQAYVGISTRRGPHVTPELFAVTGDRIVCMTAADTIKSRRLRRVRTVACTVRNGARAVSMVGKATVIDAGSPATLLQDPRRTATASMDAALFTIGNLAEMSGAALDLVTGRLGGPIPQRRVVIVIEPHAAVITEGSAITYHAGWDAAASNLLPYATSDDPGLPDLGSLPGELADLAAQSSAAVVGWTGVAGAPLTLPATWDPERAVATVPADLFHLVGAAARSPACVTFDSWSGYGPSGKQGLMLRGTGEGTAQGSDIELACTFDRVTHWDGTATASADL